MKLESEFDLGERVSLGDIVGTVTMIRFILIRPSVVAEQYEVSWFDSGKQEAGWFEPWRLGRLP